MIDQFSIKTTKGQVVQTLSESWPLNAKEIYSKIKRKFGADCSYQAVHKVIVQMHEKRILKKNEGKYELNIEWFKDVKKFSEKIEDAYKLEKKSMIDGSATMSFENLFDFLKTMLHLFSSDVLIGDGPNFGAGIMKHVWWPLNFSAEDFEKFKYMGGEHDSYIICSSNTVVDKWLKEYYLKTGFDGVALGVDYNVENDMAVVGDYITTIYMDEELKKIIHEVYSNAKDMSDVIQNDFLEELFNKKTQIHVIINKNPVVAKQLREKVLSYFK